MIYTYTLRSGKKKKTTIGMFPPLCSMDTLMDIGSSGILSIVDITYHLLKPDSIGNPKDFQCRLRRSR